MMNSCPAVFAVGRDYQIMVELDCESLFYVKAGGKCYYDESNGIMRSMDRHHRVTVPMDVLDGAGEYTVCIRPIIKRKPYFTETEELREQCFSFRPVPKSGVRAYHISDAHNMTHEPVRAAETFGAVDLLILNGDVIDHSGDPSKFVNVYEICSRITRGETPVVFSRGNHDMRGLYAEKFASYTPSDKGNTYYTFRLGSIWGILLDCGEDKDDSHKEYGNTVACHVFRERQTEFLRDVISRESEEYAADGVETRLVICHNPFTEVTEPPFDIEREIYAEWARLLREHVKPSLMICGHTHHMEVRRPGHLRDTHGQPCTVVIASEKADEYYAGCGFIFGEGEAEAVFTSCHGEVLSREVIRYGE